jgi:hypothetical protein
MGALAENGFEVEPEFLQKLFDCGFLVAAEPDAR